MTKNSIAVLFKEVIGSIIRSWNHHWFNIDLFTSSVGKVFVHVCSGSAQKTNNKKKLFGGRQIWFYLMCIYCIHNSAKYFFYAHLAAVIIVVVTVPSCGANGTLQRLMQYCHMQYFNSTGHGTRDLLRGCVLNLNVERLKIAEHERLVKDACY